MGRGVGPVGCLVVAAMRACLRGAAAETEYVVGGSRRWTASSNITAGVLPPEGRWQNLRGRRHFETHGIAIVSREVYDTCGNVTPLFKGGSGDVLLYSLGGYRNENGQYHFISTVDSDCENGQKLAITITGPTLAESPDSSARSTTTGALSMLVLSSASIVAMLMI